MAHVLEGSGARVVEGDSRISNALLTGVVALLVIGTISAVVAGVYYTHLVNLPEVR